MCMFPEKRDRSRNRQERRVYSLVTVNHRKHIESTFLVLGRLKQNHTDEVHDEDLEAPTVTDIDIEEHEAEDHDMAEPQKHEDPPKEVITYKRRPTWAREIIQDVEKYGAPNGSLRERKRPRTYSN